MTDYRLLHFIVKFLIILLYFPDKTRFPQWTQTAWCYGGGPSPRLSISLENSSFSSPQGYKGN